MVRAGVPQPAERHPHHHRHRGAPPIPNFRGVVDELIEAGGDEIVELHLADRPLARQRGADAGAEHGALGERRIDHAVAELLQERAQQQKCVAVAAADVLAVYEHPRIAAKRVANAEHHGLEEGPAFRVERWSVFNVAGGRRRCGLPLEADRWIQYLDVHTRRLVDEHACARLRRLGPRRVDHGARLLVDERLGVAFEALEIAGIDDAAGLELRGVHADRIARRPVLVQLAIGVPLIGERRIFPRRLRIAAKVQHVVVMRVPAHPHRHDLDQGGSQPAARAFRGPRERRRDRIGIGAVDRDAWDAVADRFVGKHAHRRLLRYRRG